MRACAAGHEQIKKGEWDVCAATANAYDFKNKVSFLNEDAGASRICLGHC